MSRSYEELNELEKIGLIELLKADGWSFCLIGGDRDAYDKKIQDQHISVEQKHFRVDED